MARLHGGTVVADEAFLLGDSGRPVGLSNCATLTQPLTAESAASTLARIAALFACNDPARRGEVILLSAWPTGDLRAAGWSLMGHPPVHLLPAGGAPGPMPPGLRIEEVRDRHGLHAWERVAIEGFPLEGLAAAPPGALMPEGLLDDARSHLWVGWDNERPVSASWAWSEHGINDVVMVATVPDARRRGYGEALTWRAALADHALPAMLLSSDDGRPVYERMGFMPLQRCTMWYRNRPG